MVTECNPNSEKLNSLPDFDFDVSDAGSWYRYVADPMVLTGLARRSGEAYAREVRILVRRFQKPPFMLSEGDVRRFILERHENSTAVHSASSTGASAFSTTTCSSTTGSF